MQSGENKQCHHCYRIICGSRKLILEVSIHNAYVTLHVMRDIKKTIFGKLGIHIEFVENSIFVQFTA